MEPRCRQLSHNDIWKATKNFDDSNFIKKGGEGKVYKGTIAHGGNKILVAVKCLNFNSKEFEKEIDMLSRIHHAHIISLIGYCQQDSKILVYEFMANGSLHDNIYKRGGCSLSWEQRLKICIGSARGLDYLHTGTSTDSKIIHRDVKPANILLDENFNPKISDFGLSRRGPANQTRSAVTTAVKGTVGYYAPEYFKTGQITIKVDVYAFGVVMFEVLCRKKPWERLRDDSKVEDQSISQWAEENFDTFLDKTISRSCFKVYIVIAEKCLNPDPSQRPSMSEVVSKLDDAIQLQKGDSEAGKQMLISQNLYRRTSESGNIGSSTSSQFEKSSDQQSLGSSKETKLDTTTELSKFGNISGRMKTKVETRPYKSFPMSSDKKFHNNVSSSGGEIVKWDYSHYTSSKSKTGRSSTPTKSNLPEIPGTKGKIILYSSVETHTDCHKIRLYLNIYRVAIEERDPTKDRSYEAELRSFFSRTQRQYCLPQLFIGGKYVGGADEVDRLYSSGELRAILSELN